MFYFRLLVIMVLLLTVNAFLLGLVYSLPALQRYYPFHLFLAAGVLIVADAVVLFSLYMSYRRSADRFRTFENILQEVSGPGEPEPEDYMKAHEIWEDER